jgi:hypothetical protein
LSAFVETRTFITSFTSATNLSLSWGRCLVHSFSSYLMKIHLNIIFPAKPRLSKRSRSLTSPYQNLVGLCSTSPVSHTCHMARLSRPSWFDQPNNIWWGIQSINLLII